jgi:hypothetical protein
LWGPFSTVPYTIFYNYYSMDMIRHNNVFINIDIIISI